MESKPPSLKPACLLIILLFGSPRGAKSLLRNSWGFLGCSWVALGRSWVPRAPPECPRSALKLIWVFKISTKRTPTEPAEASNAPRAPQELPRSHPEGLQEHPKRSQHRSKRPQRNWYFEIWLHNVGHSTTSRVLSRVLPDFPKFRIS